MIQCQDVKEAIWSADLTPEMIEHVLTCSECEQEQKLVQGIGITLDLEDIPMPSRSLLPARAEIVKAVNAHRWRRLSRYVTAGLAAACVLLVFTQVPGFLSSKGDDALRNQTASTSGEQAKNPDQAIASERLDDLGNRNDLTAINEQKKELASTSSTIDPQIVNLLGTYGWTPTGDSFQMQTVTLPDSFIDQPGAYPLGLYWAKHNLYAKDIGLDVSRHQGETVVAYTVPLKEMWDDGLKMNTTAVVLEKDGNPIGAWLQKGTGMAASLKKRDFTDLAKASWGDWLVQNGQVNYKQGPDAQMVGWTPEQVILKYYEAIQSSDYATAYALYSKGYQSTFWHMNNGEKLYAQSWDKGGNNPQNISFVQVIDLQETEVSNKSLPAESYKGSRLNRQLAGELQFQVTVSVQYKTQLGQQDGINAFFIGMVKETSQAPWKIEWIDGSPR
ncbi:hypothetical protein CIG75_16265 [Tumebacillus algifaecis]|uniref:DUF4830 domain-containing protein n=1 Tax=Tumebacillus algifaecis TaxID=1214604 RepID=A0A223D496_9BACL|nr:DUF4829 domain-containing protein [Tumebacillus algifaecis]ASS76350.1 hypothetical protein CIG75_16265 [Tumebacillus algifaecis]